MSQSADVNMEPVKWPIAPDGYIPNSVIRSLWRKLNGLDREDSWEEVVFCDLPWELTTDEEDEDEECEDVSKRMLSFIQERKKKKKMREKKEKEKEEKGKKKEMLDVKMKRKEKEDEKQKKVEDIIDVMERKVEVKRKKTKENKHKKEVDGKKTAEGKREMESCEPVKHQTQEKTATELQRLETSDEKKIKPQQMEIESTYNTANFLHHSFDDIKIESWKEMREDTKLRDITTPSLQNLPESEKQTTSTSIHEDTMTSYTTTTKSALLASADTSEPKSPTYLPPTESPQQRTPLPQMTAPSISKDPQPQLDLDSPECSPVKPKTVPLCPAKYNIRDQAQVCLNSKVLELYRKFKVFKKNLMLQGKHPTAGNPSVSGVTHSTAQTKTGEMNVNTNLNSSPALRTRTECPNHLLCSGNAAKTIDLIKDQQRYQIQKIQKVQKPITEWRKSLYELISLHGFCSPSAAKFLCNTTEHSVKTSNTTKLLASKPLIQPDQIPLHLRVVQKIQMKDTLEKASSHFHHVIATASRHGVSTMNECGTTQYGRLQFDWVRGHMEDKLINVSTV